MERTNRGISIFLLSSLTLSACLHSGCSSPQHSFYEAIRTKDIEGLQKYYEKIDSTKQEPSMERGLSVACEEGNKNVLDALLDLGGRLDNCNYLEDSIDKDNDLEFIVSVYEQGETAQKCLNEGLAEAIYNSRSDVIQFFVEKGADVNITSKSGQAALHHAAIYGNISLITLLLQNNADINVQTNDGETPLFFAHGGTKITKHLILNGADVNFQKKAYKLETLVPLESGYKASFSYKNVGESPLFYWVRLYIRRGKEDIDSYYRPSIKRRKELRDMNYKGIEMLLMNNADPDLLINQYNLELESGSLFHHPQRPSYELKVTHKDGTYFHSSMGGYKKEIGNEWTGMFFRIEGEGTEKLAITTNNDSAPLPASFCTAKTVSHLAAENNEEELLDLLRKYGADFSKKDSNGKTVLELIDPNMTSINLEKLRLVEN